MEIAVNPNNLHYKTQQKAEKNIYCMLSMSLSRVGFFINIKYKHVSPRSQILIDALVTLDLKFGFCLTQDILFSSLLGGILAFYGFTLLEGG